MIDGFRLESEWQRGGLAGSVNICIPRWEWWGPRSCSTSNDCGESRSVGGGCTLCTIRGLVGFDCI